MLPERRIHFIFVVAAPAIPVCIECGDGPIHMKLRERVSENAVKTYKFTQDEFPQISKGQVTLSSVNGVLKVCYERNNVLSVDGWNRCTRVADNGESNLPNKRFFTTRFLIQSCFAQMGCSQLPEIEEVALLNRNYTCCVANQVVLRNCEISQPQMTILQDSRSHCIDLISKQNLIFQSSLSVQTVPVGCEPGYGLYSNAPEHFEEWFRDSIHKFYT